MSKLIQRGNSKLTGMYMFNLPATKAVCSMQCPGCYAAREQARFPSILAARSTRLEAAMQPTFASNVISELNSLRKLPKHFRVHASGEFFSQTYVDAWVQIAKAFPSVTFYTYTKRLKDFDFSNLSVLPNFVLINSLHFGSLNYGPLTQAPTGAFVCPASDTVRCGQHCTYCMSKSAQSNGVYFRKH